MSEHTLKTCDCGTVGCMICDGGLAVCQSCHCIEGAWTSECPGSPITADRLDEVYAGKIDFIGGKWKGQTSPHCPPGIKAYAQRRKREGVLVA